MKIPHVYCSHSSFSTRISTERFILSTNYLNIPPAINDQLDDGDNDDDDNDGCHL